MARNKPIHATFARICSQLSVERIGERVEGLSAAQLTAISQAIRDAVYTAWDIQGELKCDDRSRQSNALAYWQVLDKASASLGTPKKLDGLADFSAKLGRAKTPVGRKRALAAEARREVRFPMDPETERDNRDALVRFVAALRTRTGRQLHGKKDMDVLLALLRALPFAPSGKHLWMMVQINGWYVNFEFSDRGLDFRIDVSNSDGDDSSSLTLLRYSLDRKGESWQLGAYSYVHEVLAFLDKLILEISTPSCTVKGGCEQVRVGTARRQSGRRKAG